MTNERISLKEAYDNRDVIAQIAILNDKLDSIPDADLTNVVLKTGDQIIDGKKTFNEQIVANGGVLFANNGLTVNGTLQVDGDIIQNGSAYDTHAEQVYTTNDLIVTRDGAVGGIAAGQLSGIRVKKYDGVSDLNLGVDSLGVMRVGDLGDEQPLATRDEASDMTSGALVKWDGVNKKMIAPASNTGTDLKPIKIVNGEHVPVTNELVDVSTSGQMITAPKIFNATVTLKGVLNSDKDISVSRPPADQVRPIFTIYTEDGSTRVANLYFVKSSTTGQLSLNIELLNSDGSTYSYYTLATST